MSRDMCIVRLRINNCSKVLRGEIQKALAKWESIFDYREQGWILYILIAAEQGEASRIISEIASTADRHGGDAEVKIHQEVISADRAEALGFARALAGAGSSR